MIDWHQVASSLKARIEAHRIFQWNLRADDSASAALPRGITYVEAGQKCSHNVGLHRSEAIDPRQEIHARTFSRRRCPKHEADRETGIGEKSFWAREVPD